MGSYHATGLGGPDFTENGWGLTRAPKDLMDDLLASLHGDGLDSASTEKPIDVVETTDETRPWLIGWFPNRNLNERALKKGGETAFYES